VRTLERVMGEYGLIRRHRWRDRSVAVPSNTPAVTVTAPNDLWTVDFKGWWATQDGACCEPLTVRDACSRYVLALRALLGTSTVFVRPVFEDLFRRSGLPKAIQSANGPPFAHVLSLGGLSVLSAWWTALGIHVVHSRPGCPQDNGGHERMHVDVCAELQVRPGASLLVQQAMFDEWTAEFNHVRPHEAIDMKTPAELYAPSPRKLPALIVPTYPQHWHPPCVDGVGKITHRRWGVYVSKVLTGHIVAVEELPTEYGVWFCNLFLSRYVYKVGKKVSPVPAQVTLRNRCRPHHPPPSRKEPKPEQKQPERHSEARLDCHPRFQDCYPCRVSCRWASPPQPRVDQLRAADWISFTAPRSHEQPSQPQARRRVNTASSAGAPKRTGGPVVPTPRFT
jgi:transposase InsO family protein